MARTLALGLALALGATLLAPASAAVADDGAPTCPAATLTESQLNHLIVDINAATVAKAATGYRFTESLSLGGDDAWKYVMTKDVAHGRFAAGLEYYGEDDDEIASYSYRALANGFGYVLTATDDREAAPALAVLGRSSVWINNGEHRVGDSEIRPLELGYAPVGGSCEQSGSGLTLTYGEVRDYDDAVQDVEAIGRHTVVTDSSLAATAAVQTEEAIRTTTTTLAYGQSDIDDIPATQRVSSERWDRAIASADQRSALTSYVKKVAASAKAAAKRAARPVRAADVKTVRLTPPWGAKRAPMKTGIAVIATDAYTRKPLLVTVTVAQQTVRIGDNW